ncbi:MAG: OmpA family protein [Gemmatimonas sp.]|nr:OmpA family protein [Gemmatimonas sp.]
MGFDSRESAKVLVPHEGDTLQTIAERESAAGNPITWAEIARFNWGTDDEVEIDAFLRDELGARKRGPDNHFVLSPDDKPRDQLLIPTRFKLPKLTLDKKYTLRVRKKVSPPQFVGCCSLPGITFGFDSSFVRPSVVEHLKPLEALAMAHPEARVIIFGHTDAVGTDLYNKKLSERRAWSVHAFITNDPDAWETLYNHPDENWGLPVLQEILADLGHDPGAPDGDWGPRTCAALRSFLGLPDDALVRNDSTTRRTLFAAYLASKHNIDLTAERFVDPGYMGCGEFNPAARTEDRIERNRRVTFYLFHPDRLPNLPCAFADTGPCQKQMVTLDRRHRKGFACSFYDSLSRECGGDGPVILATLRIRLFDHDVRPILDAPYRLSVAGQVHTGRATAIAGVDPADRSWVEVKLPSVPDRALIEWAHPKGDGEGESMAYPYRLELHLDWEAGSDAEEQAERRLHNLGYPAELPLADNLRSFQLAHGLADTGEIDSPTVQKLKMVHDDCEPSPTATVEGNASDE